MEFHTLRWGILSLPAALPLLPAAASVDDLSVFSPASPPAENIYRFFLLILAIVGLILITYLGTLAYCVVRYRRRPGQDAAEPAQIYGSWPIEIAWTLAPLLIVTLIFLVVVRSVGQLRRGRPAPDDVRVTVVAHQWWWEYRYPGTPVVTANELHVPVLPEGDRRAVYLEMQSADVIHDFWAPRLGPKTDVIPGRTNYTWFAARGPGLYGGQCAEFCGAQHANMMVRVLAEPEDQFRRWLQEQERPAADDPAGREGRKEFFAQACVNCHTIRGTPARGTVGPDLTHLMSRETLLTGMIPNDREHLRQWVTDPQQVKPGCRMPDMHLGREQVERIVSYLVTLR